MSATDVPAALTLFKQTLDECRELYLSAGRLCVHEYPHLVSPGGDKFIALMDDLHRALVLKIYVTICEADRKWSPDEQLLAESLFEHLWGKHLRGDNLRDAARQASRESTKLYWYSLVRPFDQIAPLREQIGTLETLVARLANVVARADGDLEPREAAVIKSLLGELRSHLRPIPIDEPTVHEESEALGSQAIESLRKEAGEVHAATHPAEGGKTSPSKRKNADGDRPSALPAISLKEALAELDALVGLSGVKEEVRTLANFLKLQKRRGAMGLPDTDVSLHMVFTGNPGTGKTTIARILGKIFGAMGILAKGHLVETDRAGLVAEYIGQTAPKTHAKIDEALDGVLFIDEAYSLVAKRNDDPYGHEAVQVLLKRAEDDRHRLIVILAGYPDEMQTLLHTNPGLSSRFNRMMHFEDYTALELAQIFGTLCEKNHYTLGEGTRGLLVKGLSELHRRRDRHFGNGRAVRNIFEQAIRRMANRIADIAELSQEQLMRLEADDILIAGVPAELLAGDGKACRFQVGCPQCGHTSKCPEAYLGKSVRCPKCKSNFQADWGELPQPRS